MGVSSLTWILSFSFRYCEESNSLISDAIGVAFPVSSFSSFLSIFPVPFDHFRILRFLACLPTMLFCYWISNCPCKYKLINSTIYVFFCKFHPGRVLFFLFSFFNFWIVKNYKMFVLKFLLQGKIIPPSNNNSYGWYHCSLANINYARRVFFHVNNNVHVVFGDDFCSYVSFLFFTC